MARRHDDNSFDAYNPADQRSRLWTAASATFDDLCDSQTALDLAGLDFSVKTVDLWGGNSDDPQLVNVPMRKGVMREDTGAIVGTVGMRWDPLNPRECFDFCDSLVEEGEMRYTSAGQLGGGQRIWLAGKVGSFEVVPGDVIDEYVVGTTGFDGNTGATRFAKVSERLWCANALLQALRGSENSISIRHTRNQRDRLAAARELLSFSRESHNAFAELAQALAKHRMRGDDFDNFVDFVEPLPERTDTNERAVANAEARRQDLARRFAGEAHGSQYAPGSAWQALCSYTERENHGRTYRSEESRFASLVAGGAGEHRQTRALQYVHNLVAA